MVTFESMFQSSQFQLAELGRHSLPRAGINSLTFVNASLSFSFKLFKDAFVSLHCKKKRYLSLISRWANYITNYSLTQQLSFARNRNLIRLLKQNQNNTNKLRSKQANKHKQIANEQAGKWQKREQANKQTTNQSNKQMKKLGFVSLLGGKALVLSSKRANDL